MWLNAIIWMFFATTVAAIKLDHFQSIRVPSTTLETAVKKEDLQTLSTFSCCTKASQQSWSQLACLGNDSSVCTLYDLELPSEYQEEEGEDQVMNQCYKKIPEGSCVNANYYYPEGETALVQCVNSTCTSDMTWIPIIGDCPDGFDGVFGVGCIMIVKTFHTFTEAKENCQSMDARLVIPDDFEALRQYSICKDPTRSYLVGIHYNKWMNGREVDANTWGPEQPNGDTQDCGLIRVLFDHKINDISCSEKHYSICQLV